MEYKLAIFIRRQWSNFIQFTAYQCNLLAKFILRILKIKFFSISGSLCRIVPEKVIAFSDIYKFCIIFLIVGIIIGIYAPQFIRYCFFHAS